LEEDENSISGILLNTKVLVCTGDKLKEVKTKVVFCCDTFWAKSLV